MATGRLRLRAALAFVALALCAGAAGAAEKPPPRAVNLASDKLAKLPPAERAATLARAVGHWCVGTEAFQMGVVATGAGAGNAYWSLRCADGSAWAVQIDPLAELTAIDCEAFKAAGAGKVCFKKF